MHSPADTLRSRYPPNAKKSDRRRAWEMRVGVPYPLGATWDGRGTNFSVFSEIATQVDLCLFDDAGEQRLALPERTDYCWHGYVPRLGPGQRYGFRVHGPWKPEEGQRANPAKLLLDPYARAIEGRVHWDVATLPYMPSSEGETISTLDSADFVPRSVVVDCSYDWQGDRPLGRPLSDTVIYELHVKGFSTLNPAIPNNIRGSYAALAHPASIEHLQSLGITAIEILPIHAFVHEAHIVDRGLNNYWGYNSIGFFAPHAAYASPASQGDAAREFKMMVKALHAAGIEVLLDVVYNHTAEGNHLGPMLSLKGFDNRVYYRTVPESPRYHMDYAGTGNTLNLRHPQTLRLVMDSLRYWVNEMHVDGFRFDLASALGRGAQHFDREAAFFSAVNQDPTLGGVKLIAEPWDVREGGYQLGNFPVRWSEWNGRYRDTVRDFWRSQPGMVGDFATRLTGSADLYESNGRSPVASVNYVTVHDGFTLLDQVSYNDKHNEANGEENRDGTNDNRSWNLGAEGPTDDPEILARRARQVRNFLATLLLSHGVPMILAGDEMGRTQFGNNNAYCQDNEISWVDWAKQDANLVAFTRRAIALRQAHGAFRRAKWPAGRTSRRTLSDIAWFTSEGVEMTGDAWADSERRRFTLFLDDRTERAATTPGRSSGRDRFLLLFNASLEATAFQLPSARWGASWRPLLDSAIADGAPDQGADRIAANGQIERPPLSLVILSCPRDPPPRS